MQSCRACTNLSLVWLAGSGVLDGKRVNDLLAQGPNGGVRLLGHVENILRPWLACCQSGLQRAQRLFDEDIGEHPGLEATSSVHEEIQCDLG